MMDSNTNLSGVTLESSAALRDFSASAGVVGQVIEIQPTMVSPSALEIVQVNFNNDDPTTNGGA